MQIILSPSKDMDLSKAQNKDWSINEQVVVIVDKLKKMEDKDLKDALKISDKILLNVRSYIGGFEKKTSYKALDLYTGLVFKSLNPSTLNEESIAYLNKSLFILSCLYGPIRPNKLIKPYRLDFLSKIKINNKSLKDYWAKSYNLFLNQDEYVLNLASKEFSSLINHDNYKWIDFNFLEYKNGSYRSHSSQAKKARGLMVRYLAENKIVDLDEIKNFNYDMYCFSREKSTNKAFTFIRSIG